MTKGVLLFAHNNRSLDYVGLAVKSAKRIKKHLNLPITLVTDSVEWLNSNYGSDLNLFEKVISTDSEYQDRRLYDGCNHYELIHWKNLARTTAFELSPYDETLVIDVDYLINSDFLLNCFNLNQDFLLFKDSYDLANWRNNEFVYVSTHGIPFYWATVFYFKKTPWTKLFFELLGYIKNNWSYYKNLYQLLAPHYRNDIAFSVAIHILNGFTTEKFAGTIPGKMYYSTDKDILVKDKDTALTLLVQKENMFGEYTLIKTENLDVHVMNKQSIMRVA